MPRIKTEVCVRVLYPSAFVALGLDGEKDEVDCTQEQADWLVTCGYGELVIPKKASD